MFSAVRLSMGLKGGAAKLLHALQVSLQLVVPPVLFGALSQALSSSEKAPPGPAAVQRAELSLDVGYMLHKRSRTTKSVARFMWTDSSPVANHDWIWCQYTEVKSENLVRVCQAINDLTLAVHQWHDDQGFAQQDEGFDVNEVMFPHPDWRDWLATIGSCVAEHICPPTALASGHRGVAHKCRAILHQWHLETPEGISLDDFADSFYCACSDMGVEMSIPDFRAAKVSELLPPWAFKSDLSMHG
jgi:hypothetical protein